MISLLLPTRQRRDWLNRFYESAMKTADKPEDVEVVVYIDNDDKSYDDFELPRLTKVRGDRIVLSEMWNKCWEACHGEIFGHMGDDIIFRSNGWDTVVRNLFNEYPDKIVFAYGNDGNGDSDRNEFGTHGFIHKNWTDTVGRFLPPYFVSDYNDTWLNDVSKALKRHRHIDIFTEHMHYSLGKAAMDTNTEERLKRHDKQHPEEIYYSKEKRIEREDEIEKLRTFIDEFTASK